MRSLPAICFSFLLFLPIASVTTGCGRSGGDPYVPTAEVPPEMTAEELAEYEKQQEEMGTY